MGKLVFNYGVMSSSKSTQLLVFAYNLEQQGKSILCLKPSVDTRNSNIESRLGISREAIGISAENDIYKYVDLLLEKGKNVDVILVDEIQFFTEKHIEQLKNIADDFDIEVRCYGLKNSFVEGELFEPIKRLLYEADELIETESSCEFCNKKATHHLRVVDGVIKRTGNAVNIGDTKKENDYYIVCCRKHYYSHK